MYILDTLRRLPSGVMVPVVSTEYTIMTVVPQFRQGLRVALLCQADISRTPPTTKRSERTDCFGRIASVDIP
jgi:hypothetical protein